MSKNIAITGGHLAPALALIEAYTKKGKEIIFFGRKHAFSDKTDISLEYQLLSAYPKLKFYILETARFNFKLLSFKFLSEILLFYKALWQSFKILKRERPQLLFSFGGYLSVPVAIAAYFLKIPIYLHEQTIAPGIANRFIARYAKKIFVSFKAAQRYFPQQKTIFSGNPLASRFLKTKIPSWYKKQNKTTILILGGSSGSHSINLIIEKCLPQLTAKYQIIHQTGVNRYGDFERLNKLKSANYTPVKFFTPEEVAYFIKKAALVITRSGANTFFLLLHYKKPCILIPLPWAANNEQLLHAKILAEHNVGKIFPQDTAPQQLPKIVAKMLERGSFYANNYQSLKDYAYNISGQQLIEKIYS